LSGALIDMALSIETSFSQHCNDMFHFFIFTERKISQSSFPPFFHLLPAFNMYRVLFVLYIICWNTLPSKCKTLNYLFASITISTRVVLFLVFVFCGEINVVVRLTLAHDKNKNKTENTFLILPKRHKLPFMTKTEM